jgi:hypothetical protein
MSLKDNLAEIIRLDNKIRDLVRSRSVLTLEDVREFKWLKQARRDQVRAIERSGKNPAMPW